MLKDNHKELETDNSAPEDQYFFPEEYFDEDEDMVPVDELPDIDDLDRQIVYHLTGFSTFRKKLNGQLCAHCQEIFFLNKVMREFFIPLDSQLTQSRDRGGLKYVETAVHHFFCDLEKILRHFFQTNRISTCINGPARMLKTRFSEARVHEIFLENEYFHRDRKTCSCDWTELLQKLSWYYSQVRINFKCDWLCINLNTKRGRSSDFANRRLALLNDLPISAAYDD